MRVGRWVAVLVALAVGVAVTGAAWAQEPELRLAVRKNYGFNWGSQIEGSFRLEATGPADLASVTFFIDGEAIGEATAPPFRLDFHTGSYAVGWHTLTAEGVTASGQVLRSAERRFEFVPAGIGAQAASRVVIPLLIVVGLIALVSVGTPLLLSATGRRQALPLGAPRKYGLLGGTICPRCQRPFSIHWWGLNLVGAKLDRCDHCGRWSVVRALPPAQLAAAEAAELAQAQPADAPARLSAEEEMRKRLEESKYSE